MFAVGFSLVSGLFMVPHRSLTCSVFPPSWAVPRVSEHIPSSQLPRALDHCPTWLWMYLHLFSEVSVTHIFSFFVPHYCKHAPLSEVICFLLKEPPSEFPLVRSAGRTCSLILFAGYFQRVRNSRQLFSSGLKKCLSTFFLCVCLGGCILGSSLGVFLPPFKIFLFGFSVVIILMCLAVDLLMHITY